MSLKGSLQTAALPEVLTFLSDTGKSGQFHVSGTHGEGRLWFDQGRISGFRAARAEQPFEAVFELLRIEDGEFTFDDEAQRPEDAVAVADDAGQVGPTLEAAEARMAEWRQIVEVVPSLAHRLQLRAEAPAEKVSLEPEQWLMVVAVGAGHTVGEVIDERQLQEFVGCRAVRSLVDASLVEVLEPAPVAEEAPVAEDVTVAEEWAAEPVSEPLVDSTGLGFGYQTEAYQPTHGFEPVPVAEDTTPYGSSEPAAHDPFQIAQAAVDAEAGSLEADHYAALRAAVVELGDDLVPEDVEPSDDQPVATYELETDPGTDSRAALQALLSEVTSEAQPEAAPDEPVDGLADRGPWTDHELSEMDSESGWHEDAEEASNIVPFAPVHAEAEAQTVAVASDEDDADGADEAPPAEEPINRGLLLKFLSSVRN